MPSRVGRDYPASRRVRRYYSIAPETISAVKSCQHKVELPFAAFILGSMTSDTVPVHLQPHVDAPAKPLDQFVELGQLGITIVEMRRQAQTFFAVAGVTQ